MICVREKSATLTLSQSRRNGIWALIGREAYGIDSV